MITARIAVIVFAVFAVTLTAQQAQPVRVSIKVTDVIGDVIPSARIHIDRASGETTIDATTDRNGEAAVDLFPGDHVVTITEPGFEQQVLMIDLKNGSDQTIAAVLEFGHISGPSIVAAAFNFSRNPLDPNSRVPPSLRRLRHHFHWL